jgi:putrescine---pyruvate transaminase
VIATTGDISRFWHPFANTAETAERGRVVFVSGEGAHLTDSEGKTYFDASGGLWYNAVGHGRERIARAIADQAAKLAATTCFDVYASDVTLEVADRVAALSPLPEGRVFLTSGGSDSIESAGKIIRRYFGLRGEPEKSVFIAREGAYHGMHAYGTSLAGIPGNHEGWGPLVREIEHVTAFNAEALEEKIREVGAERVAAFFAEPVIGAGGVFPPPEGYIQGAADLCAEHGVLFVSDSVICGFGRLGTWWGIDRWEDVRPDLITFAKGVTAGYLPLGGVVVAEHVAAPFFDEPGGPMLRHGATYAGHPTCCVAAMAVLDIYERDALIERGRTLEGPLRDALIGLESHPAVAEVRAGLGFLAAVELSEDALAAEPGAVARVAQGAREAGVLVRPLLKGIAVSPPLICEQEHIDLLRAGIDAGLERIGSAPAKPDQSSGG